MRNKNILIGIVAFLFIYYIFFSNDKENDLVGNERWTQGDYSKQQLINLDIEALQKAFENAKSPQDFEKQANELYTGDELVAIYVKNGTDKTQDVTLFIDAKEDGFTDDDRKLITLTRQVKGEEVHYSRQGYGPYSYYNTSSPLIHSASGALLTYWIMSRAFYATPPYQYQNMRRDRNSYRETPKGKEQASKTKTASKNFSKNASTKQKSSARAWGSRSKSKGSWSSGTKRAKQSSTKRRSNWGSSRRRKGFGGFRGFRRR